MPARTKVGSGVSHALGADVEQSLSIVVLQDAAAVDDIPLKGLREAQQSRHLSLCEVFVPDHRFVAAVVGVFVIGR